MLCAIIIIILLLPTPILLSIIALIVTMGSRNVGRIWCNQLISQIRAYHTQGQCMPGLSKEHVQIDAHGNIILDVVGLLRPIETDEQGLAYYENEELPASVLPFTPPEVYRGERHDPILRDLWAAMCVLIFLITDAHLYDIPHESNRNFHYFIIKGGLSPVSVAALSQADQGWLEGISPIHARIQQVDPGLLSLLSRTLVYDPSQRMGIQTNPF